ncbi:MAG: DUF177 domain-containing protein [Elusimicrobia bacterium]|nr:DUF177 domain-containing protein [Elusimicrobiota bacterium]
MSLPALVFKTSVIVEEGGLAKSVTVPAEALFADPAVASEGDVSVGIEFSVGSDEILLEASIAGGWRLGCGRCLVEHSVAYTTSAEETFPAEGSDIDLTETVREVALLELPQRSLCRPDCQGLCESCGKNLNEGPCPCPPGKKPSGTSHPFVSLKHLKE